MTSKEPADARRERLADARLYLCTDARTGRGDLRAFTEFLHEVLSGGVDVVQLRDRGLDVLTELEYLAAARVVAHEHGALLAVNDRADVARAVGADVLHLGQRDLPVAHARAIVGPDVIVGRSSQGGAEALVAGSDPDVDYFCVGPVHATPTKPGRGAVGVSAVRDVAATAPSTPWFAIGGIDLSTVGDVLEQGATRVVVVRAITDAVDPGEAARSLAATVRAAHARTVDGPPSD
ncbi:thiamine phosphate synthase [Sanguibacter suaedae]|uniref:Thiamine-phosphate synthase n=1 Tax=Sanguibacter suaedae TaxID=2795737 RepID=A0A934I6K1_9MICO|nr:thiamine phosphate synthase [Sanguibacter suaedae]MBI9114122.1 thiamine phosphate synthase [Sanguibacter suaedae]